MNIGRDVGSNTPKEREVEVYNGWVIIKGGVGVDNVHEVGIYSLFRYVLDKEHWKQN